MLSGLLSLRSLGQDRPPLTPAERAAQHPDVQASLSACRLPMGTGTPCWLVAMKVKGRGGVGGCGRQAAEDSATRGVTAAPVDWMCPPSLCQGSHSASCLCSTEAAGGLPPGEGGLGGGAAGVQSWGRGGGSGRSQARSLPGPLPRASPRRATSTNTRLLWPVGLPPCQRPELGAGGDLVLGWEVTCPPTRGEVLMRPSLSHWSLLGCLT